MRNPRTPNTIFYVRRRTVRPVILLVYGCIFLLLAACGNTAQGNAPQHTPTVAATPTPTQPPAPTPTPYTGCAPGSTPAPAQLIRTYCGHIGPVIKLAWSPDGKELATGGNDGTIQVWVATTGQQIWQADVARFTFAVAWSPDGQKIAVGGSNNSNGSIYLYNATNGQPLATYQSQTDMIEGVSWSPDNRYIVAGSQDKTVKVWDTQSGKLVLTYTGHTDSVERVAWSPDGSRIASASYDGTVQVWQALTGKQLLTYSDHKAPVWEVAWSPDSKRIVSGTGAAGAHGPVTTNNSARVWDATTGKTLVTYTQATGEVLALAWSPDGKRIASAGEDPNVRIWNSETGATLAQYSAQDNGIYGIAWSPDGSLLATGGVDGIAKVWKL